MSDKLNQMQISFCQAYVENGCNGTQAAIKAGYAKDSAHVTASKFLKMPKIQDELKRLRTELEQEIRNFFISDALVARRVMLKILNDPKASNRDKVTVAKDIMDRAGFKPTDKTEITGKNGDALEIVFVDPNK